MISQRGILCARDLSHLFLYPPYGVSFSLSFSNSNKVIFVKPCLSLFLKHAEPSWHKLQTIRMMNKEAFQNVVSASQPSLPFEECPRAVPGIVGAGIHRMDSETENLDRKAKVIVISGPTASGKTRLGLLLAEKLGGEIISADSVQVYRGLDIGSAKTPSNERQGIPHHLLDIMEPTEEYTAGDFFLHAREATADVIRRGRVPIVVGGTGLYLRWFLYGKPDTPRATPEIVASVEKEVKMATEGSEDPWAAALSLLTRAGDVTTGQQLSRNDWYRLKRALEIVQMSGRPRSGFIVPSAVALLPSPASNSICGDEQQSLTLKPASPEGSTEEMVLRTQASESVQEDFQSSDANSSKEANNEPLSNLDYDFRCFFLCPPRMDLYRRIDQRCEDMVADGLLQEASILLDKGVSPNSNPPSRAIGYRQAMEYLQECREGDVYPTVDRFLQFLSTFQQASRNYAKRQMVWFRSEQLYRWLDASREPEELGAAIIEDYGHNCENEDNKTFQNDEEMTKKRSYKEGKLMRSYRPELKTFSDKTMMGDVLNWVHDITCKAPKL